MASPISQSPASFSGKARSAALHIHGGLRQAKHPKALHHGHGRRRREQGVENKKENFRRKKKKSMPKRGRFSAKKQQQHQTSYRTTTVTKFIIKKEKKNRSIFKQEKKWQVKLTERSHSFVRKLKKGLVR